MCYADFVSLIVWTNHDFTGALGSFEFREGDIWPIDLSETSVSVGGGGASQVVLVSFNMSPENLTEHLTQLNKTLVLVFRD